MRTLRRIWLAGAVTCSLLMGSSRAATQQEINPALLYWQAFAVMPDLSPEEQKHLLETPWRTRPMDQRAGELAARFDSTFKLLRAAAASEASCDWGVDLSLGPEVLLPHLAKAKRCATVAVLRSQWAVQQGRPQDIEGDLVATFVLGRNLSRDGTIISALVQVAMERMMVGSLVQQWPELPTDMIRNVLQGFDEAPPRGTMARAMQTERVAFYGWLVRKIRDAQARHPGDDNAALQEIAKIIEGMRGEPESGKERPELAKPVIQAAGGTTAGLLRYLAELEPMYRELERVMALPCADYLPAIERLEKEIRSSPNLLAQELLPAVLQVRDKEFKALAWLAMIRAAYEYRVNPAEGLQKVVDPFGTGPFSYRRFVLDGIDHGFILKSELRNPDFPEILIFAEKTGAAFYVDGPRAGQKIQ